MTESKRRRPRGLLDTSTVILLQRLTNLPIYTCNPADFDCIDGLEVVAVPSPA